MGGFEFFMNNILLNVEFFECFSSSPACVSAVPAEQGNGHALDKWSKCCSAMWVTLFCANIFWPVFNYNSLPDTTRLPTHARAWSPGRRGNRRCPTTPSSTPERTTSYSSTENQGRKKSPNHETEHPDYSDNRLSLFCTSVLKLVCKTRTRVSL